MAPIRRYLRITKYSVLEIRIYLENPALAQSWLLNPRDPVLPRVIESVRPLVLPKLREERDRERSNRKNKKRSIKDVVTEDDFEVSIFLTGTDTRHSLLFKQKLFRDKTQTKLTSNSSKLTGEGTSLDTPIDLGGDGQVPVPGLREESPDDQEPISLDDIPNIREKPAASRRSKRFRGTSDKQGGDHQSPDEGSGDDGDDEDHAFQIVDSDSGSDASHSDSNEPPTKRRKETETDDKKKLAMDISYEGFSIYGRVLCLVIKRRGPLGVPGTGRGGFPAGMSPTASGSSNSHQMGRPGGQAMMENWITSTQLPEGDVGAGDDDPVQVTNPA